MRKLTVSELSTLKEVLEHSVEQHVNEAGTAAYQQGITEGHARGMMEGIAAEKQRVVSLEPAYGAILRLLDTADAWEANRIVLDASGAPTNLEAAKAHTEAHVEAIHAYRQATTIKK